MTAEPQKDEALDQHADVDLAQDKLVGVVPTTLNPQRKKNRPKRAGCGGGATILPEPKSAALRRNVQQADLEAALPGEDTTDFYGDGKKPKRRKGKRLKGSTKNTK